METIEAFLVEVPKTRQARYVEIVTLTDRFCDSYLNDEYKELCRAMAISLCQEGTPVSQGKAVSWAAGVAYALGWVNFLSDPSTEPSLSTAQMAKGFEVSQSNMMAKARVIREGLGLVPMDPVWTLASRLHDNPLAWMVEVDGLIVDARMAPREFQEAAYEAGLIPYVPDADDGLDDEVEQPGAKLRLRT